MEPFAGSARLFFAAQPEKAVLGDINDEVISVYRAVRDEPNEVSCALESIPRTSEAYYLLRATKPELLTSAQRAARLIFLMKACFNGVYRTNKSGLFNVPMGNRIYAIPNRQEILDAHYLMRGLEVHSGDFKKTLQASRPGDWIYLDPPYRMDGRYRGEYGYRGKFCSDDRGDLVSISRELGDSGRKIMLSYCHDEGIIEAFSNWNIHRLEARRSVSGKIAARGRAIELVLTNY